MPIGKRTESLPRPRSFDVTPRTGRAEDTRGVTAVELMMEPPVSIRRSSEGTDPWRDLKLVHRSIVDERTLEKTQTRLRWLAYSRYALWDWNRHAKTQEGLSSLRIAREVREVSPHKPQCPMSRGPRRSLIHVHQTGLLGGSPFPVS